MEAFYWSASLGSFASASKRLNTTQSTIAKRVSELEAFTGVSLFTRRGRTLQITDAGLRFLVPAREMLDAHFRLVRSLTDMSGVGGRLRIGATDLVGLTWLPLLIRSVKTRFPLIQIEPEIDGGLRLYERLSRNEIDIAIMPGPFVSPQLDSRFLGTVENVWMASPDFDTGEKELTAQDVSHRPVIVQPASSALTELYSSWFKQEGFAISQVLTCNSLGMVAQLTIYGLGLSYLPKLYFMPLVSDGRLRVVPVRPTLPPVNYYAFSRRDDTASIVTDIVEIAAQVCDFSIRL